MADLGLETLALLFAAKLSLSVPSRSRRRRSMRSFMRSLVPGVTALSDEIRASEPRCDAFGWLGRLSGVRRPGGMRTDVTSGE